MKKILFVLACAVAGGALFACAPAYKTSPISPQKEYQQKEALLHTDYQEIKTQIEEGKIKALPFRKLSGYFLQTSVELAHDINFITINSERVLTQTLGKSAFTQDSYPVNFAKTFVAIIAFAPSTTSYNMSVSGVYLDGTDIYILYKAVEDKSANIKFYKTNYTIVDINRPKIATGIHFIDDSGEGYTINYGRRTEGSPEDTTDVIKNYTGVYRGTLTPVRGESASIITVLQILPNHTFVLRQSYTENPDRVFQSEGKWAMTEDLSSIVLNYDKSESQQMKYYFLNPRQIERLAPNGDRYEDGQNILRK
jgi:hypothetical protein